MATAALNISGHTGTQLTRTLERVLEDAQVTGELRLSGRKLKEFPKNASKYNLTDTVVADLSKNRFSELPVEICDYVSMERLDCYHNAIRSIPESVIYLNSLTHLNLCRNQLTTIPLTLCQLSCLQVLIISNNKLVSIPEEVGRLSSLMELDVSCNEISHLPSQIEDLENLKSLDLRRNLLVELPIEITNLRLTKLDISCNRISVLPPQLRLMRSLVDLILDSNPLISPPAFLCTRGRVHIFKYLEIQAIKEDKKRGVISEDFRRSGRKAGHGLNGLPLDNRRKRYTVDSGYNTSEGGDKRWSQELELNGDQDESRKLALRAAELTKEQRQERERGLQMRLGHGIPYNHPTILNGPPGSPSTPSTISPGSDTKEDIFTRELNRQKTEYEAKKRLAERVRLEQEEEEAREEQRRAARKIMEQQMEESRKKAESRSSTSSIFSGLSGSSFDYSQPSSPHIINDKPQSPVLDNRKSIPHDQTYREYREALKQRRIVENNNIYRRHVADGAASVPSLDNVPGQDMTSYPRPNPPGALVTNHITPEEEFRARHETLMQQQRIEAQLAQHRLEEERRKQKQIQKEAVFSYFKSRTSPHKMLETEQTHESYINKSHPCTVNGTSIISNLKSCSPPSSPKIIEAVNPNFTIRRDFDKAKEEAELIQQLRNAIEMRLKVALPNDVSSALMDGVVLCHLANHVRPRSVSSIHVPSPAVPKLTMAKCRRNVENFLDACRRIGVAEEFICTPHEILDEMKSPVQVAITVQALLKFHHASKQNST